MRGKLRRLWHSAQKMLFLKNQSLVVRMLIFSWLLVVVPLGIVGMISYGESSKELEEQARESSWQIIEQVKTHIEYYITGFEIDSIKLLNQPEMKRFLQTDTAEEMESSGLQTEILYMLKNMAYSRSDLSKITVIMDAKLEIHANASGGTAVSRTDTGDILKNEYWYEAVPNNGDIKLVSRVIYTGIRNEPVITMAKRLIHPYTLEPVGMLLMDINFKRIQEISDKVTVGRTGYLSILNSEGYYMYHPDLTVFGKQAEAPLLSRMHGHNYGFFQMESAPGKYMTFGHSPYLNWYLVTTLPGDELFQGVNRIRHSITWTVVAMLLVAYVLGIGFATSLIRPILRLKRFVGKVRNGNLKVRATVESKDEIGQLTMGFNSMVERLEELLEEVYVSKLKETQMSLRQRETELKMLQSQLNPHFLFNSLETIRGMALEHGMKDISVLSAALAKLLRYNLNNESPYVKLKDELAVCEMYLRIQRFRFEDKMQYSFTVPDEALQLNVLKFSLQPLVENCMIHGVEPAEGMVNIQISAEQDKECDRLIVTIKDTGLGIPRERLAGIQLDLHEREILSGGSHIGIVNVHRRLVHLFGECYGLELQSKPMEGTEVKLYLPLTQQL